MQPGTRSCRQWRWQGTDAYAGEYAAMAAAPSIIAPTAALGFGRVSLSVAGMSVASVSSLTTRFKSLGVRPCRTTAQAHERIPLLGLHSLHPGWISRWSLAAERLELIAGHEQVMNRTSLDNGTSSDRAELMSRLREVAWRARAPRS